MICQRSVLNHLAQNLRFPGQYADQETGYNHNGFRTYAADLGRYLQSDPIGLAGGLNPYAYAMNNPLARFDRTGLAPNATDYRHQYEQNNETIKELEADARNEFGSGLIGLVLPWKWLGELEKLKDLKDLCDIKKKLDLFYKYQQAKEAQKNIVRNWAYYYQANFNSYFTSQNVAK